MRAAGYTASMEASPVPDASRHTPSRSGRTGRPALRAAAMSVVVVAAGMGLPGQVGVTLPWAELGHARDPMWETVAWAGVLFLLHALLRAPRDRLGRGVGLAGAVLLGVSVLTPSKFEVNRVTPATAETVATPMLGPDGPRPMRWTRATLAGSGLTRATDVVADEWLVMRIAGGVHQDAGRRAVAAGTLDAARAAWQDRVRRALWAAQEAVIIVVSYGRAAIAIAAPWVLWALWRDRAPRVLGAALRLVAWGVPLANAITLLAAVALGLPDDRALWGVAAGAALGHLGLVAAVDWGSRR